MDSIRLRLVSEMDSQNIDLYRHDPNKSIVETIAHSNCRVYQDRGYVIYLDFQSSADESVFSFFINDVEIPSSLSANNVIEFETIKNGKLFKQSYGYIQIQVSLDNGVCYESGYIPVMVKKGIKNDSVRRMTEYIYRYNATLLSSPNEVPDSLKSIETTSNRTIEAKLVLLKKILDTLERNYSYFRINCRYKTEHVERIDYFEKLQYVSASTIQYISQHPDELRRTTGNTGIVINGYRYQPERTLITQNQINYEIDENRAILGFVDLLSRDIKLLKKQLDDLLQNNEYDSYEDGDYVSSTYYVYVSTINMLSKMKTQIEGLEKRVMAIQLAYHTVFRFKTDILRKLPKPSALFVSISQYKQVYDCMNEWLSRAEVGLQQQNQILGLKKMNEIYELYVLLKLVNHFKEEGYVLCERKRLEYAFSYRTYYQNTWHTNLFRLVNGTETVSVFYQPVIYSDRRSMTNGIGLYRNTSFPKGGEYYTPDYIVKVESTDRSEVRYIIVDAKYSDLPTVKQHEIKDMVFKYLFSITPINPQDKIVGLCLVNGQSDLLNDSLTDIYDRKLSGTQIYPRAVIITLTENSENNIALHTKLIDQGVWHV